MSIQDWGSLGELIAGVATLITLVYLAVQIRQNTRSVRGSTFQDSVESINRINTLVAGDTANARVFRLGTEDSADLTEDEQGQFNMLCLSLFRVYENMHYQAEQGAGNELWIAIRQDIPIIMALPGVSRWWLGNPYVFTERFRSLVENSQPDGEHPGAT